MNKYVIIGLLFAILLTGCISTEVKHKQYVDGSADITQSIDLSLLSSYANTTYAYGSTYNSLLKSSSGTLCSSYQTANAQCEEKDGVVTLTKKISASEAFYKFEVRDDVFVKKYRLTVDKIETPAEKSTSSSSSLFGSIYGSSGDYTPYSSSGSASGLSNYGISKDGMTLSGPNSKAVGILLEQMKVEYKYTVEMPGSITEAEGAKNVSGNKATFDVVQQLKDKKPIVVVSEEVNWPIVLGVGAFALLLILVAVGIVVMLLKPRSQV